MALVPCRQCNELVPRIAQRCIHCGALTMRTQRMQLFLGIAVLVIAALGIVMVGR